MCCSLSDFWQRTCFFNVLIFVFSMCCLRWPLCLPLCCMIRFPHSLSSKVEHQHVVEYACCDHEHKGDGAGIVHLPTLSTWLVLAQDGRPPTFLSNQTILVVQVVGALA